MTAVRGMLGSKKWWATMLATVGAVALKFGVNVDNETLVILLAPIVAYVGAQAYAERDEKAEMAKGVTVTPLSNGDAQ